MIGVPLELALASKRHNRPQAPTTADRRHDDISRNGWPLLAYKGCKQVQIPVASSRNHRHQFRLGAVWRKNSEASFVHFEMFTRQAERESQYLLFLADDSQIRFQLIQKVPQADIGRTHLHLPIEDFVTVRVCNGNPTIPAAKRS